MMGYGKEIVKGRVLSDVLDRQMSHVDTLCLIVCTSTINCFEFYLGLASYLNS